MRMSAPFLAVIAATLLVYTNAGAVDRGKNQAEESVKKVKELRKERIAVLKKLVEHLNMNVQGYEGVPEAMRLLSEAELEAAETDKERIELCKKLVDVLKRCESRAEKNRDAGRGTVPEILKAKAKRLEAEIRLELVKKEVSVVSPKDGVKPPANEQIEASAQEDQGSPKGADRRAGESGGRIHCAGPTRA